MSAVQIPDQAILERFARAVRQMLADDDLIKAAPQEFSITPDLAFKLQHHFPEWRVSAEWTSREDKTKKVTWQANDGKLYSMQIRPDIIVHTPHSEDNILVVEAKRVGNKKHGKDIKKLTLMTLRKSADPDHHYGYRLGVHLIVDLPKRNIAGNDVYRDGAVDPKLTELLTKMLN